MTKDSSYSIRISSFVLQALKRAAKRERRTVASLLDKIILDYLEKGGFLPASDLSEERRMFFRKKVTLPANSLVKLESKAETFPAVILDISLGGVLVAYPKDLGSEIASMPELPHFDLLFKLPSTGGLLRLPCSGRRVSEVSGAIQVGATFHEPNEDDLRRLQTLLM